MNKVVWNEEGRTLTYELGFLDALVLVKEAKRKPALAAALKALMPKAEAASLVD